MARPAFVVTHSQQTLHDRPYVHSPWTEHSTIGTFAACVQPGNALMTTMIKGRDHNILAAYCLFSFYKDLIFFK